MSASLVGSEMCIRDSARIGQRWLGSTPMNGGSTLSGRARPAGLSKRARAVSYTHLTLPTICSV
eukprot:13299812-Alexandrium_andersonii.AAC.1